jgi:hypothetical protein
MSVLPAGHSLARFVPDLDELLYDPAEYLKAAPLTFGPRRMWGLAALFLLAGLAFLLSVWYTGDNRSMGERLALGVGLSLGGMVWLGWSLMMHGHQLVLHPEGVEVKYRDTAVWCPWALFNTDGDPYVPQSDSPMLGMALPINPEAVPFIELRRNEAPMAHGVQVKASQLVFASREAVVLPARYEVEARELGDLLLRLGRRLGRKLPSGTPTPEAMGVDQMELETPTLTPSGWFTAPLTRLRFPPHCCHCGQPTTETMDFHGDPGGFWFFTNLFASSVRPLTLPVPMCVPCQEWVDMRRQRIASGGTAVAALIGLAIALALSLQDDVNGATLRFAYGLFGVCAGGIVGFLIGAAIARRSDPVRLRRFSPSRGTVSIHFANAAYAEQVLDLMRKEERARH